MLGGCAKPATPTGGCHSDASVRKGQRRNGRFVLGHCSRGGPSALTAGLCTTDPVGMRSTVGLVVLTQEPERGTSVTELAETFGGALFGEDPKTFHNSTLRPSEHRREAEIHAQRPAPAALWTADRDEFEFEERAAQAAWVVRAPLGRTSSRRYLVAVSGARQTSMHQAPTTHPIAAQRRTLRMSAGSGAAVSVSSSCLTRHAFEGRGASPCIR